MFAELPERFVRAVRAGGEAVCAEADPREERDERELVKGVRILDVLGRTDEETKKSTWHDLRPEERA